MGHGTRGWLIGLGAATAVGAAVFSLAPAAGASTASPRQKAAGPSAAVASANPAYVPSSPRTLRFGMRNKAVKALQRRLNQLHYYAGKADGYFGWDTMEAVWAFKEVQS